MEQEFQVFPKLEKTDISLEMPEVGGTEIITQRHGEYVRKKEDIKAEAEGVGGLTQESARKIYKQAVEVLDKKLSKISSEDRKNVDILIVSSDTKYGEENRMRSYETANEVMQAVKDALKKYGLEEKQLLNNRTGTQEVALIKAMQEPRFLNNVAFVDFLKGIYGGINQKFWADFEEDAHKKERENMGAEGPDELVKRFSDYVRKLVRFSEAYHRQNPGKRLLIWTVSHYDTVSPFVKRYLLKTDPKKGYLPVGYGAGASVLISPSGQISSSFQREKYDIDLSKK